MNIAAAPRPNSTVIGGAGISVPDVDPVVVVVVVLPEVLDELEVLEELDVLELEDVDELEDVEDEVLDETLPEVDVDVDTLPEVEVEE